jgi:hypothetical protein
MFTVSCNTMDTLAVVSVTSASSNKGVADVVINVVASPLPALVPHLAVIDTECIYRNLSRSKPTQPHD